MNFVSVIIPAHNRAKLLERCLNSLVSQTYKNFEVIVVDDNSIEDIKAVVDRFVDRLEIYYLRNDHSMGGPARPRNIAISKSKGNWIAFLDNDDFWYSDKLEKCSKYLNTFDLLYHELDIIDVNERISGSTNSRELTKTFFDNLLIYGNAMVNSSVLLRRSVLEESGFFDENPLLIAIEDYDLWLRVSLFSNKFKFINESLGGYYIGDDNISKSADIQLSRLDFLYSKHLQYIDSHNLKKAEGALAYAKAHCCREMGEAGLAKKQYVLAIMQSTMKLKIKAIFRYLSLFF